MKRVRNEFLSVTVRFFFTVYDFVLFFRFGNRPNFRTFKTFTGRRLKVTSITNRCDIVSDAYQSYISKALNK